MSARHKIKASLFVGTSLAVFAAIAAPALAQEVAQAGSDTEAVIVTGTRVTGMTAADSAAPVTVIGADALSHVAQPNLIQSLAQNIPSFNAEAHGADTGALTLSARLRGISPNDTLVLVNGKRRHASSNLHVDGGQFQGAATTDLDLIPVTAIDHIEVLQDGAAAQYGTDAIAGVVNIILKKNSSGGTISATGGQHFEGDGDQYDFTGNVGFPLGSKGFINFSAERRFRNFTYHAFGDVNEVDATGAPLASAAAFNGGNPQGIPGYPNLNKVDGQPISLLNTAFYNAEYEVLPEMTLYSYGSYGRRSAKAFENYRPANRVIANQYSNQQFLPTGASNPGCTAQPIVLAAQNNVNSCYQIASSVAGGTYTTPGQVIFNTQGFQPLETLKEDDYSYTFGAKGEVEGWSYDLSGSYGKDLEKIGTSGSVNLSSFTDFHTSPTEFYDGSFIASQLTGNFDVSKNFEVGMATPLSVAFGFEAREDTYFITPGDPASYYKTGAQSFPGYSPAQALAKSRKNYAEYIDLAVSPIKDLQLDIAGRHEYYTDFHDAQVGKITARYDFSPAIAIRGTVATGFRAPTLPESYYNAVNVSPTSATLQIGPNSPAALVEGIQPLKPESSVNYSVGFVAHLWDNFSATVDGYSIAIGNRIVGTGTVNCKASGTTVNTTVCNAITASGQSLDPSVPTTGTSVFANAVSTLTHGVDITANYASDFADYGNVNWTAGFNWGETSVSRIAPNPAPLGTTALFTPAALSYLTSASPKFKLVVGALWNLDAWTVNLRESVYGPSTVQVTPSVAPVTYYPQKVGTAGITDLDVTYAFTDALSFTLGANNLFDQKPETIGLYSNTRPLDNASVYFEPNSISPYGVDGGYYFGRVTITF
jgi:iron complex outermembrane receptor protein